MRDHDPVLFEEFNGWYKRGDADSTPPDHFVEAINIDHIDSGFKTRDGIEPWEPDSASSETRNCVRMYEFSTDLHHGLLILNENADIYYIIPDTNDVFFVLHVAGMTDFSYVSFNGFAFIGPGQVDLEQGLDNEFLYVYDGTSTPARKAAGDPPIDADGALAAANSGSGNVESGIHIFGVVYETDSGFLTQIGPDTLPTVTATGSAQVALTNVPVSGSGVVVARHIVASKSIDPTTYTGDPRGYELFFVPDGTISDNIATTITVNFFDIELLESAAYLFDILSEIPAPGNLAVYHNRLVVSAMAGDLYSTSYLSQPGEPEAISALDGLILLPRDRRMITCAQEYRDILYIFKIDETRGYADNGDVPSSWQETIVDNQIGCAKHGMARRGEDTAINIEYLLMFSLQGIFLFNGTFQKPEFSYKIENYWNTGPDTADTLSEDIMYRSECHNDVRAQIIYINIPRAFIVLVGNYKNGFDPMRIRWSKWQFNVEPTTMSLFASVRERNSEILVASNGTTDGNLP